METKLSQTLLGVGYAGLDNKLDTIDTNVDDIETDTGTTLPATLTTIDAYFDVPTADATTNATVRDVVADS